MDYQNYNNSGYSSYAQQQSQSQASGALGWDDEIKDEKQFILLPEADYFFRIKKFEKGRFNGSDKTPACNKAIVTFEVFTQNGERVEITENFLLLETLRWKLAQFFSSIGMLEKDGTARMNWSSELIGKQGVCKVSIRTYQKDGENRQINYINKLYPSYDQPALAPPQQTQQQYTPPQQYQQPAQQQYAPPQQPWNQGKGF